MQNLLHFVHLAGRYLNTSQIVVRNFQHLGTFLPTIVIAKFKWTPRAYQLQPSSSFPSRLPLFLHFLPSHSNLNTFSNFLTHQSDSLHFSRCKLETFDDCAAPHSWIGQLFPQIDDLALEKSAIRVRALPIARIPYLHLSPFRKHSSRSSVRTCRNDFIIIARRNGRASLRPSGFYRPDPFLQCAPASSTPAEAPGHS